MYISQGVCTQRLETRFFPKIQGARLGKFSVQTPKKVYIKDWRKISVQTPKKLYTKRLAKISVHEDWAKISVCKDWAKISVHKKTGQN